MDIEKLFKNLILIDFGILILLVFITMYQSSEITLVQQNLEKGFLSNYKTFSSTIPIILFFTYLFNLNLLYRFIFYSRPLYLVLIILGLSYDFLNGPVIFSALHGNLNWIGGALSGAILILLYFSPISSKFNK